MLEVLYELGSFIRLISSSGVVAYLLLLTMFPNECVNGLKTGILAFTGV